MGEFVFLITTDTAQLGIVCNESGIIIAADPRIQKVIGGKWNKFKTWNKISSVTLLTPK